MSLFTRKGKNPISTLIARNAKIINFMRQILLANTHHYKSDFRYDIAILKRHVNLDKPIVWLSRECGTWCFLQENLRDPKKTSAYTFMYYEDCPSEHAKSFEIDNLRYDENHHIIGDIYAMDYKRACKWIRKIHKEQNVDFSEYRNINNESVE